MAGAPSTLIRKILFRVFSGVAHPPRAHGSDKSERIVHKGVEIATRERERERGGDGGEGLRKGRARA